MGIYLKCFRYLGAFGKGVQSLHALLYALSVEALAAKIRQSQSLKGFNFSREEKTIKLAQYADDAILFLNDKEELCSTINIIKHFGQFAGSMLNLGTCEGLWLRKNKHYQTGCKMF